MADHSMTRRLKELQDVDVKETRKQRKRRHLLYLNQIIGSNTENMKRKMQDLVDNVYNEEREALASDLDKCQDELRRWEKKGEEPVNFDVMI